MFLSRSSRNHLSSVGEMEIDPEAQGSHTSTIALGKQSWRVSYPVGILVIPHGTVLHGTSTGFWLYSLHENLALLIKCNKSMYKLPRNRYFNGALFECCIQSLARCNRTQDELQQNFFIYKPIIVYVYIKALALVHIFVMLQCKLNQIALEPSYRSLIFIKGS